MIPSVTPTRSRDRGFRALGGAEAMRRRFLSPEEISAILPSIELPTNVSKISTEGVGGPHRIKILGEVSTN